jgi:WD40 repeat protein
VLASTATVFSVKVEVPELNLWHVPTARRQVLSDPDASASAHTGALGALAFSHDGRRLASAGEDTSINVWDTASGKVSPSLRGHFKPVTSLAYQSSGAALASASHDGTVRIWEPARGIERTTLRGHAGSVTGVAFAPGTTTLASSSLDGTMKLWDTLPTPAKRVLSQSQPVLCLAAGPDQRTVAFGGGPKWRRAVSLAVLAGGQRLAWVTEAGALVCGEGTPAQGSMPDSLRLLAVPASGTALAGSEAGQIQSLSCTRDGRLLVCGGRGRRQRRTRRRG